jgi:hypothetical protein
MLYGHSFLRKLGHRGTRTENIFIDTVILPAQSVNGYVKLGYLLLFSLESSLIRTAVITFDKDDGSVVNTNYGWTRLIWIFRVRHLLYWFIVCGCHDCHSCVCVCVRGYWYWNLLLYLHVQMCAYSVSLYLWNCAVSSQYYGMWRDFIAISLSFLYSYCLSQRCVVSVCIWPSRQEALRLFGLLEDRIVNSTGHEMCERNPLRDLIWKPERRPALGWVEILIKMGLEWICEGTLVIKARLERYTIKVSLERSHSVISLKNVDA